MDNIVKINLTVRKKKTKIKMIFLGFPEPGNRTPLFPYLGTPSLAWCYPVQPSIPAFVQHEGSSR